MGTFRFCSKNINFKKLTGLQNSTLTTINLIYCIKLMTKVVIRIGHEKLPRSTFQK